MKAEDFYITNYRSKYNLCLKENRKIEQYTFDDVVEFAERYFESRTQANGADTGQDKCHIQHVSGSLPPALVLYRAANTMTFEDFAKWYNNKSGNDH